METGFSAFANFKPEGSKIFSKKNFVPQPRFSEQHLKCSGVSRTSIAPTHGNKFPLNFKKQLQ